MSTGGDVPRHIKNIQDGVFLIAKSAAAAYIEDLPPCFDAKVTVLDIRPFVPEQDLFVRILTDQGFVLR